MSLQRQETFNFKIKACKTIAKISLTSSFVINVPTRTSMAVSMAVETKDLLFLWLLHFNAAKISLTSSFVINVPTRASMAASMAVETKDLLFLWLLHFNNKKNVCKQISSLFDDLFTFALAVENSAGLVTCNKQKGKRQVEKQECYKVFSTAILSN